LCVDTNTIDIGHTSLSLFL